MNSNIIGVVNYGIGNIFSVVNTLEKLHINYRLVNSHEKIKKYSKIILIGVGSFSSCMESLKKKKFDIALKKFVRKQGKLLGICVGMQVLLEYGLENKKMDGLGLIKGSVEKMNNSKKFPLPHIGWNEIIKIPKNFSIFENIKNKSTFYFLHSFSSKIKDKKVKVVYVKYGNNLIAAAVQKNNLFGVQFHPEKSQEVGMQLIKNFVNLK
tara:strand:+ start:872 stop:1498 length:627 start_codon:yes stop_codon:yes gene_type:complete